MNTIRLNALSTTIDRLRQSIVWSLSDSNTGTPVEQALQSAEKYQQACKAWCESVRNMVQVKACHRYVDSVQSKDLLVSE